MHGHTPLSSRLLSPPPVCCDDVLPAALRRIQEEASSVKATVMAVSASGQDSPGSTIQRRRSRVTATRALISAVRSVTLARRNAQDDSGAQGSRQEGTEDPSGSNPDAVQVIPVAAQDPPIGGASNSPVVFRLETLGGESEGQRVPMETGSYEWI